MTISKDGIRDAAAREAEAHPMNRQGKIITAWDRRKSELSAAVDQINWLTKELSKLKEDISSRPF